MPRTQRHRQHRPAAPYSLTESFRDVVGVLIGTAAILIVAVAFFSDTRIPPGIKLIPLVGAIALGSYVLWSFGSFLLRAYQQHDRERANVPDRRRRREGWELSDPAPADKMAKRLDQGETPYLGADGEIYFKKPPKHTRETDDH